MIGFWRAAVVAFFALIALSVTGQDAHAGHLFTQSTANTPIHFTPGASITVTQNTYEGAGTNGNTLVYFTNGTWTAGDSVKITIGAYSETFAYDTIAGGGTSYTQNSSSITGISAALAAANISANAGDTFQVEAVSGDFTWEGYRITVNGKTFNGTGAAPITQDQVVGGASSSTFQPVSGNVNGDMGGTLDKLKPDATGEMKTVLDALAALPAAERAEKLQKIAPETGTGIAQAAAANVRGGMDSVKVRINEAMGGFAASDLATSMNVHEETGISGGDGPSSTDRNFWIKGFYEHGNQDQQREFAGFKADVHGTSFGFDYLINKNLLAGVAYSYSSGNVNMSDFRTGDGTDILTHQITPYVAFGDGPWAYEFMQAFVYHDFKSNRNTATTGIAYGDFYGLQSSTHLGASYTHHISETWRAGPEVAIEYDHNYTSEYAETGASVLSMTVNSGSSNRVRSIAGASTEMDFEFGDYTFTPSLGVKWTREYLRKGAATTSTFLGGGDAFGTPGQEIDQDKFGIALNLALDLPGDDGTIAALLKGETSDSYYGYSAQLMYRVPF